MEGEEVGLGMGAVGKMSAEEEVDLKIYLCREKGGFVFVKTRRINRMNKVRLLTQMNVRQRQTPQHSSVEARREIEEIGEDKRPGKKKQRLTFSKRAQ